MQLRVIVARESDPPSNLLVTIRRLYPCQFPLAWVPFFLKRSKSTLTLRPRDFECNRHAANVMESRSDPPLAVVYSAIDSETAARNNEAIARSDST